MRKLPVVPLIVVAVLIIAAGIVFAVKQNSSGPKATPTPAPEEEATIERLSEDAVNVVFTPRSDLKAFTLTLKDLKNKGYKQFEYEVSYDAESTEEPGQIITQGSASKEPTAATDQDFSREILLGTCSKNVCKYDRGVKSVKILLRLTDSKGKVKVWEKEFPL